MKGRIKDRNHAQAHLLNST